MKGVIREIAIVLGIALLGATLSAFFHPKRPAWYRVASEDEKLWAIDEVKASALIKAGKILWVDARPAVRYEQEHFPGAISLDMENWSELMFTQQEVLQSAMGSPVIVYCDGNRCEKSQEVAKRLRELLGLDPVYLLKGKWRSLISD